MTPQLDTPQPGSEGGPEVKDAEETPMMEMEEQKLEPPEEIVKVLVVEDNVVNRKILVRILSSKLVCGVSDLMWNVG
jgi:PleD family two-component response regulator